MGRPPSKKRQARLDQIAQAIADAATHTSEGITAAELREQLGLKGRTLDHDLRKLRADGRVVAEEVSYRLYRYRPATAVEVAEPKSSDEAPPEPPSPPPPKPAPIRGDDDFSPIPPGWSPERIAGWWAGLGVSMSADDPYTPVLTDYDRERLAPILKEMGLVPPSADQD